MTGKTRLELTWIGKDERPRLEPRILIEDHTLSHIGRSPTKDGVFENKIIFGDNLLALRALQDEFEGKIKCIYIDPPYNTGSAFLNYEDNLEHSIWLSLMNERIRLLRSLLSDDGVIFVQIDDNEIAYLTVMMDEIFGRSNRMNIISVKMSEATGVKMAHAKKRLPKQKEFILMYKKNLNPKLKPIRVPRTEWNDEYKELLHGIDESNLEIVKDIIERETCDQSDIDLVNDLMSRARLVSLANFFRENSISDENRDEWKWKNSWRIVQAVGAGSLKERALRSRTENDVSAVLSSRQKLSIFKTNFDASSRDPRIRLLFADKYLTYNPGDFWTDIKTTGGVGEEGGVYFPKGKKPEALIRRIIEMCTDPDDIVLDSFAGSGTTGAVAHKLRRRWIMVELREQAETHVVPRLRKIIDGEDASGITEDVGWKGGGGFRFYRLAPSLLAHDKRGNWVISKEYDAAMLAEAMCRHMGFTYAPSQDPAEYWMHGRSTETDFIYVTTASLTHDQLRAISEDVGPDRTLKICCKAFSARVEDFDNLTVVKIPHAILARCEWGRDDYSLRIAALPEREEDEAEAEAPATPAAPKKRGRKPKAASAADLFGDEEG